MNLILTETGKALRSKPHTVEFRYLTEALEYIPHKDMVAPVGIPITGAVIDMVHSTDELQFCSFAIRMMHSAPYNEVAVFDSQGAMIAIGVYPQTRKFSDTFQDVVITLPVYPDELHEAEYSPDVVRVPEPKAQWEDPRVQTVYQILGSEVPPNDPAQHWDGFTSRRIVDALFPEFDEEECRAAFEGRKKYKSQIMFRRTNDGQYRDNGAQRDWELWLESWQASRNVSNGDQT